MPAQPISSPATPITKEHLVADLRALGLDDGATVMVHTSLRSLGWVIGGAQTVLEALREAWRGRRFTMDELDRYAAICRMQRVMQPYLEVLTA